MCASSQGRIALLAPVCGNVPRSPDGVLLLAWLAERRSPCPKFEAVHSLTWASDTHEPRSRPVLIETRDRLTGR